MYGYGFFSKGQECPKGTQKWEEHAEEGGKESRPSLILVVLGVRVMVFENRSGVRPFTSNVGDDYTLIEVI